MRVEPPVRFRPAAALAPRFGFKAAARARPVVPPKIEEWFLPAGGTAGSGGRLVYRPAALGVATLHYTKARTDIDVWRSVALLAPLREDESLRMPWEAAAVLEEGDANPFLDLVASDPGVPLDHAELASLLNPARFVGRASEQVRELLEEHREELDMIAEALLEHEVLDGDQAVVAASVAYVDDLFFAHLQGSGVPEGVTQELEEETRAQLEFLAAAGCDSSPQPVSFAGIETPGSFAAPSPLSMASSTLPSNHSIPRAGFVSGAAASAAFGATAASVRRICWRMSSRISRCSSDCSSLLPTMLLRSTLYTSSLSTH